MTKAMRDLAGVFCAAAMALAHVQARAQDIDVNALLVAGAQVAQLVDARQTGVLWDGASPVAKQAVSRQSFTDTLDARPGRRWAR